MARVEERQPPATAEGSLRRAIGSTFPRSYDIHRLIASTCLITLCSDGFCFYIPLFDILTPYLQQYLSNNRTRFLLYQWMHLFHATFLFHFKPCTLPSTDVKLQSSLSMVVVVPKKCWYWEEFYSTSDVLDLCLCSVWLKCWCWNGTRPLKTWDMLNIACNQQWIYLLNFVPLSYL